MFILIPLAVVITGLVVWAVRQGRTIEDGSEGTSASARSRSGPVAPGDSERGSALDRWVAAGLIDADQAAAIMSFERSRQGPPRRVSLVAEALGYAGAALAVGGLAAAIGPRWSDLATGWHLGVTAGSLVLLVAGGWLVRGQQEPAFVRLAGVLWFLAVGAAAGTSAVVTIEVFEISTNAAGLPPLIAAATAMTALLLWWALRSGLQHTALFAASISLVITGLVAVLPDEPDPWVFALAVWGWGLLWLLLGWRGVLAPSAVAVILGTVTALAAPLMVGAGEGWLLGVGLLTAAAAVAVSIPTRDTLLLAAGTVAMFAYVSALIIEYFRDTLGMPVALAGAGVVILGVAVAAGRMTHREGPPPGALGPVS